MALLFNVDDTIKTVCLFFSLFFWLVLCDVPLRDQLYWRSSLPNDQFLRLYGLTISECIRECKLRPGCSSVNYKTLFSRCEINDINDVLGRINHPGSIFAVRTEWEEVRNNFKQPY